MKFKKRLVAQDLVIGTKIERINFFKPKPGEKKPEREIFKIFDIMTTKHGVCFKAKNVKNPNHLVAIYKCDLKLFKLVPTIKENSNEAI